MTLAGRKRKKMHRTVAILLILAQVAVLCLAVEFELTRKTVVRDRIRDYLIAKGHPRNRAFTDHYLRSAIASDESLIGDIDVLGEIYLDLPIGTPPQMYSLQCSFLADL